MATVADTPADPVEPVNTIEATTLEDTEAADDAILLKAHVLFDSDKVDVTGIVTRLNARGLTAMMVQEADAPKDRINIDIRVPEAVATMALVELHPVEPEDSVLEAARFNYLSDTAEALARRQKASLTLFLAPNTEEPYLANRRGAACQFLKILMAALEDPSALGVLTNTVFIDKDRYLSTAQGFFEQAGDTNEYPVHNLIWVGLLYDTKEGEEPTEDAPERDGLTGPFAIRTFGMDVFGLRELEIRHLDISSDELIERIHTLYSFCNWALANGIYPMAGITFPFYGDGDMRTLVEKDSVFHEAHRVLLLESAKR